MLPRFQLVTGPYSGSRRSISCDGLVPGAALDLSHWQGNRTPRELKADTSTEMALAFAASAAAAGWQDAIVVNNHFDTDGILSVFALLAPDEARRRRGLMVAAAEAGDFDEWPSDHRGLWVDAAIRRLAEGVAGDDRAAYDAILPTLPALLDGIEGQRELWGSEWDALEGAATLVGSGEMRPRRLGTIGLVEHGPGVPEIPGPVLAKSLGAGTTRSLLAFAAEGGLWLYRYELPRHAWADVVVRSRVRTPDASRLAGQLGAPWTAEGLPGMTGVVRTTEPVRTPPDAVAQRLGELDPSG